MPENCGLLNDSGAQVPLTSIDVAVKITGFVADVNAELKYSNDSTDPIEAVFVFPLDDQSAVYKFEARIDDRLIVAEIQSKEQAKETYKQATEAGKTAALLEESDESSDVFVCKLGNLPQGKDATLTFGFITELQLDVSGGVKFVMPTVLNPRYNLSTEDEKEEIPIESMITYVSVSDVPYKLNFSAEVSSKHSIDKIESEKDAVNVDIGENGIAKVSLKEDFKFNHDITLYVHYKGTEAPQATLERGDQENATCAITRLDVMMLNFIPKLPADVESMKNEFIFIIDRSGSMQGDKIKQAREALLLFLKSLPSGNCFNVVGFGSEFKVLFSDGSEDYNEKNVAKAMSSQKKIEADLGGTEILKPLKHVFSRKVKSGFSRQVFVLTDGDCWNTQTIFDEIKKQTATTRVFTIGIGEGASTALVKGMAKAGRGKYEFVTGKTRLHAKVMNLLKCAMQPAVTDMKLTWELPDGVKAIQIPSEIPQVFDGDRMIMYTVLDGETKTGSGSVTLHGQIGKEKLKEKIEFSFDNMVEQQDSRNPIHRLAAKAQIKDLLNCDTEETKDSNKEEITLVSMSANIVSPYTAFVAVDKSGDEVDGKMVSVCVPRSNVYPEDHLRSQCLMDCGFADGGGMGGFCSLSAQPRSVKKSKSFASGFSLPRLPKLSSLFRRFSKKKSKHYGSPPPKSISSGAVAAAAHDDDEDDADDEAVASTAKGQSSEDAMMALITLQQVDGNWKLTQKFANTLNAKLKNLEQTAESSHDEDVWAAALAVAYLRTQYMKMKDEWILIEAKALKWMMSKLTTRTTDDVEKIITEAIDVLSKQITYFD